MKRIQRLIRQLIDMELNSEIDLKLRLFFLLTVGAVTALFIAFLTNLLLGESFIVLLVQGGAIIVSPIILALTVKRKNPRLGVLLLVLMLILVLLPVSFIYSGGVYGGTLFWCIFAFLYIGLVVNGKERNVLLGILILELLAGYYVSYFYPDLIRAHTQEMFFADSLSAILLVGIGTYATAQIQNSFFWREQKLARERRQEIEDLNKAQNRFFSSMSHEIRTPINTIIGLDEMILREDISEEVAEDARNIQSAGKMLLALINDILDMSKMEMGKMDIVPVSYDVGAMLSEIVNMIWSKANEKGLEFYIDVDPEMPSMLFGDEMRIKQILINLLNNAVKYTREGSVRMSIHGKRNAANTVTVTYSIEDTGMGIKKESIPFLFDAFKRVDEEKNRYIEGTGLGLSIVKQLVDLMGGEISVNSIYTRGSTFLVTLEQEIVDGKAVGKLNPGKWHSRKEKEQYHQSFEAPQAHVLIVDDNMSNLMVAAKLLRDTKVQTEIAESGAECLEKTLTQHFDVILMDHLMPEMDGIECLHELREQPGGLNRNTPVVILTANAGGEHQALYEREGFDGYLVKPVSGALLEAALLKLLPSDMVKIQNTEERPEEEQENSIIQDVRRRVPLLISTDSVSDLPEEVARRMQISILPYQVHTDKGTFLDGVETETDAVLLHMKHSKKGVRTESPTVREYENFFADQLAHAQNVIHVVMARQSSNAYANACEAAKSFHNVTVVDSGHLSSGVALMVMEAKTKAVSKNMSTGEVVKYLERLRDRMQTSFILESTEYLTRAGRLSPSVDRFSQAFMMHPIIVVREGVMKVRSIQVGQRERAWRSYISSCLRYPEQIDRRVLFITYSQLEKEQLEWIGKTASGFVKFEKIYFQKASPAISINCGPGTFGLIFMRKLGGV
ncbi:MAG: DegV family EDD domain-containing protein [Lachnospiraceae bacterium]|nr:DegV family EDD domain-containing protein [Lachnospiraceae bacterium]